jgi:hypothetical protein
MSTLVPHERPWYRQFWPWLLIAIPLAGMIMASVTATYAWRYADVEVRQAAAPPLEKTNWESYR